NSGSYGSANGQALKDWNYATISSWSRPCTACHTTDLMTEHVKNSIAFSLGGKADKCVACHELKVDTFSARWNGSCAGESSACHNVANGQLHNNWATKHNASSQVMSQPGTSVTRANTTVVNETWGTGTTWPTAWTRSDTTNITVVTGGRTGSRLRITSNSTTRTTRTVVRTFNTSAYNDGVSFSVWYQTAGLSTATGSNRDWMRIEYSPNNGTTWYPIEELSGNVGTWTNVRTDLPAVTQLQIRLSASFNAGSGEFAYFDDLVIEGTTKTTAALPAGSTAAASCQNNPNGTECHDVSDVASIHSGLSNFGCDRCHNATQHPAATQLNCQTAACHPGVNRDHHAANQHTTSFSSTAVFGA
ncbi:MAG: hypothetical protein Q8M66_09170, partial [Actinomycetota bacterium]|nr:hypothetical protein [Actinomycetota bacterium]